MANEFFRAYGPDAAITITPTGGGILEVFVDGEKIYDRIGEGNRYPDLTRVQEMKKVIQEKLDLATVSAD